MGHESIANSQLYSRWNQVKKISFRNIKLAQCSHIRAQRNELQKQPTAPTPQENRFSKILNESKGKSCHRSLESILIEYSTGQCLSNQSVTAVCIFVLYCSFNAHPHNDPPQQLQWPLVSQILQRKNKASRINIQWEIMRTRALTVQFSSGTSKAALQQLQWTTFLCFCLDHFVPEFGHFFFFQFSNSLSSLVICGESQCVERGNQFAFTEYSSCLLQNAIQGPPFCLFSWTHSLIAY